MIPVVLCTVKNLETIDQSMYVSGFSCTPVASIQRCNQRGASWVQMCPSVRTQWITPLSCLKKCLVSQSLWFHPLLWQSAFREANVSSLLTRKDSAFLGTSMTER